MVCSLSPSIVTLDDVRNVTEVAFGSKVVSPRNTVMDASSFMTLSIVTDPFETLVAEADWITGLV